MANITSFMDYIFNTPGNTNPRILKTMIENLLKDSSQSDSSYNLKITAISDVPTEIEKQGDLLLITEKAVDEGSWDFTNENILDEKILPNSTIEIGEFDLNLVDNLNIDDGYNIEDNAGDSFLLFDGEEFETIFRISNTFQSRHFSIGFLPFFESLDDFSNFMGTEMSIDSNLLGFYLVSSMPTENYAFTIRFLDEPTIDSTFIADLSEYNTAYELVYCFSPAEIILKDEENIIDDTLELSTGWNFITTDGDGGFKNTPISIESEDIILRGLYQIKVDSQSAISLGEWIYTDAYVRDPMLLLWNNKRNSYKILEDPEQLLDYIVNNLGL